MAPLIRLEFAERALVKIVWESCVYGGNAPVPCVLCGRWAKPMQSLRNQALLAVVYDDHGKMYGEVCRSCVQAGAEEIKTRLQERITGLRGQLSDLETLNQGEVELPSLEHELRVFTE